MSSEPKRITYLNRIKDFAINNVFKKINADYLKSKGHGAIYIIGAIVTVGGFSKVVFGAYNSSLEKYRENEEKKARRKMVGNDVANGLAWSHYCGYLQYVLPDIEKSICNTEWFKQLPKDKQDKIPKKLYELIPRKCYVDIAGNDDNIQEVGHITVEASRTGNKRHIHVPIYSIKDGGTEYFCLCECPPVLKTINNVDDIQTAGIYKLPRSKTSPLQPFTVDTKLVQLMRFYFALTSLLCLKDTTKDKARLVLFNESEEKLSKVLLQAIKEDLPKNEKDLKKQLVVEGPEQRPRPSLMEKKLLSAEENKDIVYAFDVFVTQSSPENSDNSSEKQAVEEMSKALEEKKLAILSEKDCLGHDWLEKLKFAATKCRWIVLLEQKEGSSTQTKSRFSKNIWSENKSWMSFKDAASLKSIFESRKVQTVAVVNKRDELQINDDLRWVTCIPHSSNDAHIVDTLFKVLSGSEVKLYSAKDVCLRPGEVAVGLAWGYVVNYLIKALPGIKEKKAEMMKGRPNMLTFKEKLFIVVPDSCETNAILKDVNKYEDTTPTKGSTRSYLLTAYQLHEDRETYFFGQYPPPVDVLFKMKEQKIISEEQMKAEVTKFCTTVDKIMKILLKGKEHDFEFVYYNDKKDNLAEVMSERIE